MRISDWSSDVCSSDLLALTLLLQTGKLLRHGAQFACQVVQSVVFMQQFAVALGQQPMTLAQRAARGTQHPGADADRHQRQLNRGNWDKDGRESCRDRVCRYV